MGKEDTIVEALGGAANIKEIEACATRLRTWVVDPAAVEDAALKAAGAFGVMKAGSFIQVIVGDEADHLADRIRDLIGAPTGGYVEALGGAANIKEIEACATRLRTWVVDPAKVDDAALKASGAFGVMRAGSFIQVIVGTRADSIAAEIQASLA